MIAQGGNGVRGGQIRPFPLRNESSTVRLAFVLHRIYARKYRSLPATCSLQGPKPLTLGGNLRASGLVAP